MQGNGFKYANRLSSHPFFGNRYSEKGCRFFIHDILNRTSYFDVISRHQTRIGKDPLKVIFPLFDTSIYAIEKF